MSRVMAVSYVFSRAVEARGGLLIHGALAEWNGKGVILAGKSGVGKSTASARLTPAWRSLSDDATLIVPDGPMRYKAGSVLNLQQKGRSWYSSG
jgi:SynChlorMet cassette protein ScmC